jgi:PKD repeat protein
MSARTRTPTVLCVALLATTMLSPLVAVPAAAAVGLRANAGGSQVANAGDTVTFDGSRSYTLSGGQLNYSWDFNQSDGIQVDATGVLASHLYPDAGIFVVTLTLGDGSQNDTDQATVIVTSSNGTVPGVPNLPPVARAPLTQMGLQNNSMVFDGTRSFDPNGDNLTFEWDFDDRDGLTAGGDAQGAVVNWTYTAAGLFNITMIVSDGSASDSDRTNAILLADNGTVIPGVNVPPVANAGGDKLVEVDETAHFDANGSFDLDGDALTFEWDMSYVRGDGFHAEANGQQVDWVYHEAGLYNVSLRVTDGKAEDTDTVRVYVSEGGPGVPGVPGVGNIPPIAIITEPLPGARFEPDAPVNFNGTRSFDPEGEDLLCRWDLVTTSGLEEIVTNTACAMVTTFSEPGLKEVLLRAQDESGAVGANQVTILINGTDGPLNQQPEGQIEGNETVEVNRPLNLTANYTDTEGDELSYVWDFDLNDGLQDEATGRNITWVFNDTCTCTVTVRVSDGQHRNIPVFGFLRVTVEPRETFAPHANAGNDTTTTAGQGVIFNGTGNDSDGVITLYEWDFDGNGAYDWSDPNTGFAVHAYQNSGTFSACLRVTDNDDLTATDCRQVEVAPRPNNLPVADAGPDKPGEVQGVQVYFHGTGSDSDGAVVLYEWDFNGDGSFDFTSSQNGDAFHTYSATGAYSAVLRVTDDRGGKGSDTTFVNVGANKPPVANAGQDKTVAAGENVHFNGAGSKDDEGPIAKYSWDFDSSDGLQEDSTEIGPSRTYNRGGAYLVTLTVWDAYGQTATDTVFVTVIQTAGVSLVVDEAGREVAPGQSTSYLLTVTNSGDGTDSISLTVEGLDPDVVGWYTLDQRNVADLPAGGVRTVHLTVNVPANGLATQVEPVTVRALSQADTSKSAAVDVTTFVAAVNKIETTITSAPETVTPGSSYDVTVRVVNRGNDVARVTFEQGTGEGAWLVLVTPAPFPIQPGQSKDFQFKLNVPAGQEGGSYTLTVTATALGVSATSSDTTTVEVPRTNSVIPGGSSLLMIFGIVVVAGLLLRQRPSKDE